VTTLALTPVAQYVRMSTDQQVYSISNQKAAIGEYARLHGFEIIRTYEDPAESGLQLKHRSGLRTLLLDVVGRKVEYKKILVLDVTRWGRFQDVDESAHYEFVCRRAGINVIYCAEDFENDNTASAADYFAKVLKRTAAAEYSRELSVKTFANHKRCVQLGFRVGSQPGYGLRRMLISAEGKEKGILLKGESKLLMADRVTLVHGPAHEVRCVREIFRLCGKGLGVPEIAHALGQRGLRGGRTWKPWMIDDVVRNPKYAGTYVWNKSTERLRTVTRKNDPECWITRPNTFPPIVSQAVFDKAQLRLRLRRENKWTDEQLLQKLRVLLAQTGYLSERLIQRSKGIPSLATYHRRLGTFPKIYSAVNFVPPPGRFGRSVTRQRTQALREGLFRQIEALFPGRATWFHQAGKTRKILKLNGLTISVLLCRNVRRLRRVNSWSLIPVSSESEYMTLVCRLNSQNDGFHSFHLFRAIDKTNEIRFTAVYPWLSRGEPVRSLEELYKVAERLHDLSIGTRDKG
jgi:DNA invertase Pin-like site-specific DNA recombinase